MGGVGARLLVLSVVMSMVLSADIITDRLEPAAFPGLSRMEPRRVGYLSLSSTLSARLGAARASRSGRMFRQRAQVFVQARANGRNCLIHISRAEQVARQCFVDVLADRGDLRL
jgi:hypothetical protein